MPARNARPEPARRPDRVAREPRSDSMRRLVVAKLLAVLLLFGASGLLYHVAASDDFRIASVAVTGTRLLTNGEVEATAAVSGINIFWLRQEEVARRLQALPAIESVQAGAYLPNRYEVRISERTPVAAWIRAGTTYLVDGEGRALRSVEASATLPTIRDMDAAPLVPGATVDRGALATLFRLQEVLPRVAGLSAREFEYSADAGVSVLTDAGVRIVFGRNEDLDWKVTALVAVRRELERQGQRAEVIDVRFKDRPYVR